jgi:hypothetical protein
MTCIRIPNGIICVSPYGRLHLGNRYIMVEMHEYCGPTFFTDRGMTKVYEPKDENDPIWPVFDVWLKKFNAAKAKARTTKPEQADTGEK